MGRTGFWNKKRVSEAKHYPTGVRRYCDKHNVTFESYQNYCWRHQISAESAVTDRRGNAKFTFELFQQALQSSVPTEFCREHNLSYATFYNYKKNGFPSSAVEEADLKPAELTNEDVAYIFDDIEATSEVAKKTLESSSAVNKPSFNMKPKGFWSIELINTAKTYEGGIDKFCKDYGVTINAYRRACIRLGVSSALPNKPARILKRHFWSAERIEEAKSYPGGIAKFCADNSVTVNAYRLACYNRGIDPHTYVKFAEPGQGPVETKKLAVISNTQEDIQDMETTYDVFDKVKCSVIIKFKDGRVKEITSPDIGKTCFVLPSDSEIESVEFVGKGSISFI